MAETKDKTVRWRETEETDPSGFAQVVHVRTRVVEGKEAPEGAETTTDEHSRWTAWKPKESK